MSVNNFQSVYPGDTMIYGASRPGYPRNVPMPAQVQEWIAFMQSNKIKRVCCLLDSMQLKGYTPSLSDQYEAAFGKENVLFAPVQDYTLASASLLSDKIIPFLNQSLTQNMPTVVHCAGGIGRTGHVLCAWLVYNCIDLEDAVKILSQRGRDPLEAVHAGHASMEDFEKLMRSVA